MYPLETWEKSLKKEFEKWQQSKKTLDFTNYASACATFLCSKDFQNSHTHWFCGPVQINHYAMCSLLLFGMSSSDDELNRFHTNYETKFQQNVSKCVKCRVLYQISIEQLIEFLVRQVKIKHEHCVQLVKNLHLHNSRRLQNELTTKTNLKSTLTEFMWSEDMLNKTDQLIGLLVPDFQYLLETESSPGSLFLVFNDNLTISNTCYKHIAGKVRPEFGQIMNSKVQLSMFLRFFVHGFKAKKSDLNLFRLAKVLQILNNSEFARLVSDQIVNLLNEIELGLGFHFLILVLAEFKLNFQNFFKFKSQLVTFQFSLNLDVESEISVLEYSKLKSCIVIQYFKLFLNSKPQLNEFDFVLGLNEEMQQLVVPLLWDAALSDNFRLYSLLDTLSEMFVKHFKLLKHETTALLFQHQCKNEQLYLNLNGFWQQILTGIQFARYVCHDQGAQIALVSKILDMSSFIIPPTKQKHHPECLLIINSMLNSVTDMASPHILLKVVSYRPALKTLMMMCLKQDKKLSLTAEVFIKQALSSDESESMITPLVQWNPLLVLQVMNDIQEEACREGPTWLPILSSMFTLSIGVIDVVYVPHDGIDTTKNQRFPPTLLEYWTSSWRIAGNVLKNIREWSKEFQVQPVLDASLDFCTALLGKFRLIDADLSQTLPTGPQQKSWGWMLASPAIDCINNMKDMLKLNQRALLVKAHAVIISILNLMRSFKVSVPQSLSQLFRDLAVGKSTCVMSTEQLRELLVACNEPEGHIGIMLAKGNQHRLGLNKHSSKSTSVQQPPPPPNQPAISEFFKPNGIGKPIVPVERTIVNNQIVPKTTHSPGINAIRAQLEQQQQHMNNIKKPKLTQQFGPIHPERPPGFNNVTKKTSTPQPVVIDMSSDDDDEDVGGALSTLRGDAAAARLREAYNKNKHKVRQLPDIVNSEHVNAEHLAKMQAEKELQMMKKRLNANSDVFFRVILGWNYFGSVPAVLMQCAPVPNKFDSVQQYKSVMCPLLYLEAWEQIQQSKQSEPFVFSIVFGKRVKIDDFTDVYVSISRKVLAEAKIQEGDMLVLGYNASKQNEKVVPNAELPHCFAKVKEGTFKYSGKEFVDFQVRLVDNGMFLGPLHNGSVVSCFSLGNLTTLEREYISLTTLEYYGLVDDVLQAQPTVSVDNMVQISQLEQKQGLNKSQATAVHRSLNKTGFTLIQGPPGTGKTKTITSIIGAYFTNITREQQKRVLVCAPSNAAVDEIVLRLKGGVVDANGNPLKLNLLRLGRMDKVADNVKDLTLDSLVVKEVNAVADVSDENLRSDHTALIVKRNELRNKLSVVDERSLDANEVTKLEGELKLVCQKIREKQLALDTQRERLEKARKARDLQFRKQQAEIVTNAQVVLTTLSASSHPVLISMGLTFDTVIVDEAAQCIELSCLIPLKYGCKSCIMVGDPNQLPPTVLSKEATKLKYNQSLFVRMFDKHKDVQGAVCMLNTQYRMHPQISEFPSQEFYKGKLHDADNLAQQLARPWHTDYPALGPYTFFDIAGRHESGNSMSLHNKDEAKFALQLVEFILKEYPKCGSIGVITPYKEQVSYLRKLFQQHLGSDILSIVDFNSVDGFQGQEKDIIIMSCVRASDAQTKTIGFLSDVRRLNVAITRAKTSLWILGRSSSLKANPVWKHLTEDAFNRGRLIQTIPGHFRRSIDMNSVVQLKRPQDSPSQSPPPSKRTPSVSSLMHQARGINTDEIRVDSRLERRRKPAASIFIPKRRQPS